MEPRTPLTAKQQRFVTLCKKDDLEIYYYSGRGMFGGECPAINVDSLSEVSFNPDHFTIDTMGRGYVIYCP